MQVELLSPAGNKDIAIAAVNCGADAVYIGAPRFGARAAVGNSIADIESVCKYAHRYGVKVYATLNTLLHDFEELQEARRIAFSLYESGCDAIIFQDMSLLDADLPPLPLHASTQCDNSSVERVLYLQERGVQRVVLPREFSLAQIREVRDRTTSDVQRRDLRSLEMPIELEAFIHGALCVSYSGRCYMSEYLTGRSANRGECSQPCRSYYNLIDGKGNVLIKDKHLLSLKDLSLADHLKELANAGIKSFKIEGRLKDIDYVKNVTAFYRKLIDSLGIEKTSAGEVSLNFTPQLDKTFSRGFTTYFFDSTEDYEYSDMASFDLPSSIGEYVGTVAKIDGNKLHIKPASKIEFHSNDGIYIQDKNRRILGSNINNVTGNILTLQTPFNVATGTKVFRSFDHKFNNEILKENAATRIIPTTISLNEKHLTITDNYGNTATLTLEDKFEKALNAQTAKENLEKQLRKSNELFEVTEVNIALPLDNLPFIPISKINEIRRQLFAMLENVMTANIRAYLKTQRSRRTSAEMRERTEVCDRISSEVQSCDLVRAEQVNLLCRAGATSLRSNNFRRDLRNLEMPNPYLPQKVNITKVPLMKTRYCILNEIGQCPKTCNTAIKQPLFIENNGKKFLLKFNCNVTPCGMEIMPANPTN